MMKLNICLAPVVYLGLMTAIQTSWHTQQDIGGIYADIQTCNQGLGAHVKFSDEWVAYGLQYSFDFPLGQDLVFRVTPGGGGHYSNTFHPYSGIRQITKLSAGVDVSLSYKQFVLAGEYRHGSNGRGFDPTNAGQDMYGIKLGIQFSELWKRELW